MPSLQCVGVPAQHKHDPDTHRRDRDCQNSKRSHHLSSCLLRALLHDGRTGHQQNACMMLSASRANQPHRVVREPLEHKTLPGILTCRQASHQLRYEWLSIPDTGPWRACHGPRCCCALSIWAVAKQANHDSPMHGQQMNSKRQTYETTGQYLTAQPVLTCSTAAAAQLTDSTLRRPCARG
jgi:hypothetical protein